MQSTGAFQHPAQRSLVEPVATSVKGAGARGVRLPLSCLFNLCMVNCQEVGTLNKGSANGLGSRVRPRVSPRIQLVTGATNKGR